MDAHFFELQPLGIKRVVMPTQKIAGLGFHFETSLQFAIFQAEKSGCIQPFLVHAAQDCAQGRRTHTGRMLEAERQQFDMILGGFHRLSFKKRHEFPASSQYAQARRMLDQSQARRCRQ